MLSRDIALYMIVQYRLCALFVWVIVHLQGATYFVGIDCCLQHEQNLRNLLRGYYLYICTTSLEIGEQARR